MWIFTSKSFLSIVEHMDEPSLLHVRARFPGDIEEIFPQADVVETPHGDYRFRTSLPREEISEALTRYVTDIHYDNFKNSVHEPNRKGAYIKVWEAMSSAQER